MARSSHLPIWKAAMDLAVHLEHAVRRFPHYHKYSLGQDLRQCARRLCRLITRTNEARLAQRAKVLDELMLTVEDMKTLLTLAQETRALGSFNEFAVAADLVVGLGKQSGWRQGAERKPPAHRSRPTTARPSRPSCTWRTRCFGAMSTCSRTSPSTPRGPRRAAQRKPPASRGLASLQDAGCVLQPEVLPPPTVCVFDRTYAPTPGMCDFAWVGA